MARVIQGASSAVTQGVTSPTALPAQAVAITDGEGTLLALTGGALPTSSGSGPTTSLNAATAVGPGTTVDLGVVRSTHTLQTTVTGTPTAVTVNLEGSLAAAGPWATLVASTSTTGDVQTVSGRAVRYVRANLAVLTGGTAPTVTALIASAQ
jgi:hypothetical protein